MMRYVIGVDEAGRGPLAGPVAVGAVAMREGEDFWLDANSQGGSLRDSKKMTVKQREWWAKFLKNQIKTKTKVALVGVGTIDRINISRAADLGAKRAVEKILAGFGRGDEAVVILDYGIKLKLRDRRIKGVVSLVQADKLVPAVSLAAVAAKVRRDNYMKRQDKIYPEFGFKHNAGYGTKGHIEKLRQVGATKLHRRSFIKNFLT